MDGAATAVPRHGDWVVTLDVEDPPGALLVGELAVRALSPVVTGTRTYLAPRTSGYSFTVIGGAAGPQDALTLAVERLTGAQQRAGLEPGPVVCAEVTLVGHPPVPAGTAAQRGCENPAS
jgi:hypothetical protein